MAEEIVIPAQVIETEPVTELDEDGPSWQELSSVFQTALLSVNQTLEKFLTVQTEMATRLEAIATRVPENLVQMLTETQQVNARLVAESMETVRSLLTPPPEPVVIPVPEPEPQAVVVDPPAPAASAEPAPRKRRVI